MGVIAEGTPQKITSLKDKTIRITIDLQEIDPSRLTQIFGYLDQYVKFYMTTENISQDSIDIIDDQSVEVAGKSPAKRLRNVLYRMWEHDPKGYEDSELHYRFHMEQLINHYKDKLP